MQAAINAATNLLPSDLPSPPIYGKVNPADAPILTLAVTSKTLPLTQVQDLVETRLAQKISQVSGVGLVSLSGGQRPAVRIQANPLALAPYGLNLDDLRTTISNLNVNTPKGSFDGPTRAYTINANDQLTSPPTSTATLIIAYKNGRPVMLTDVATVDRRLREHQARRLGQYRAGDRAERAAPAGRQRHRDRRQRSRRCCRSCRRRCRPRSTCRSSPTAPPPSAPRSATCSSSWCWRSRWW